MTDPSAAERTFVFLSHATPEDNEFTLWLSLQLAGHGYPVWCDLTKLLGGEDFWDDIQKAIANRTAKFLFVLSKDSNKKDGALQELAFAKGVAKKLKDQINDFVITLRLDDIAFDDIDIRVHRQNHIDFNGSWAKGLHQLLKKLEDDQVSHLPGFNRDSVTAWWRQQFGPDQGVADQPETLLSNWFVVEDLPPVLYIHTLRAQKAGPVELGDNAFLFPTVAIKDATFLSFAKAEDFPNTIGQNLTIHRTDEITLESLLAYDGSIPSGAKHLSQLLRLAWDRRLASALPSYEMATGQGCYFFKAGMVSDDSVDFINADGKKAWRGVVGFKTIREKKRIWHFGISGKPIIRPETLFVVKSHVLFSDDGQTLWTSKDAMGRARRNQCRAWWNDDWRDRLLATMSHLANGEQKIWFPLGSDVGFALALLPACFESPVSYSVPSRSPKEVIDDYFEFEADEDELDGSEEELGGSQNA